MDKIIEQTMHNLEQNGMQAIYAEHISDVVPIVKSLMQKGDSVSHGGSETLKESGVIELLKSGDYTYFNRDGLTGDDVRQCYLDAFGADVFLTSSNAVTQRGELYNVDGNSNRVACIVYGPKNVIVIVGKNKIVPDIDAAIKRVKTVAAPKNTVRLNCDTPCKESGHCVSLDGDMPYMCDGCKKEARICCNYVVTAHERHKGRMKVIIVNDNLGY